MTVRWYTRLGAAALAVAMLAGVAFAVSYSWSSKQTIGDVDQYGTWLNGVNQLAQTIDKKVSPAKIYTHFVYVADYTTGGVYTNDTKCSSANECLANYYVRSTNGGKTWGAPVELPRPANRHADRVTIAATGSTVIGVYMDQANYWAGGGSTFDTAAARYAYYTRNTNHGSGAWSTAKKLPGQTASSRGDYLNAWASGNYAHVVMTNTQNGDIWYWRSTDKGKTWANPVTLGSTTEEDLTSGYVGGYSGLPTVAGTKGTVIATWTDNTSGRLVYAKSTNDGGSWGSETEMVASGTNANLGYAQMDARDTRIALTWTTASGGFLKIYDTGSASWDATQQFATFPDTSGGANTANNKGGEGAMVGLGPNNFVGISISECNQLAAGTGCELNLTNNKALEQLVWYHSEDNGASWSSAVLLQAAGSKTTAISNYGDVMYVKKKPLVVWNGHDAWYGNYQVYGKVGTPA